mmetsp:Transcript_6128/g.6870  ORF Transcript_6128/g.6870 Transcript_6128/m.6870 type:complete len:381 (+) Transcript_6128:201-1343(+)
MTKTMIRNFCCIAVMCCWYYCLCTTESTSYVASAWITSTNQREPTRRRTILSKLVAGSYQSQKERKKQGFYVKRDCHNIRNGETRLHNRLFEFLSVYESKIPEELKEEIFQAEANTESAKDRGKRVGLYTCLAIVGIALASFNGYLTELRADSSSSLDISVLEQIGFEWVLVNPILNFLFTNKIGGGICLLFGGASGLLAEAEFDTKRLNAEKIYEELERRRDERVKKKERKKTGTVVTRSTNMRLSGKEKKRLRALAEVMMDDDTDKIKTTATAMAASVGSSNNDIDLVKQKIPVDALSERKETSSKEDMGNEDQSIFGKMKELYEQADSMAASQALIMNKNLEDAGVVEKITDETGLRVIGREEAKKFFAKKNKSDKK